MSSNKFYYVVFLMNLALGKPDVFQGSILKLIFFKKILFRGALMSSKDRLFKKKTE